MILKICNPANFRRIHVFEVDLNEHEKSDSFQTTK
jgi:hypothetical protein